MQDLYVFALYMKQQSMTMEKTIDYMIMKKRLEPSSGGLPAELFKHGAEEVIKCIHQLLCKI